MTKLYHWQTESLKEVCLLRQLWLRTFLGPFTRFHVRVNDSMLLTADIPIQQARDYFAAQNVVIAFPPESCQVLPLQGGQEEQEKVSEAETV